MVLGLGVLLDVVRRGLSGAEPEGVVMVAIAAIALLVNRTVLPLRSGIVCWRPAAIAQGHGPSLST
jgi:hypothetical protein